MSDPATNDRYGAKTSISIGGAALVVGTFLLSLLSDSSGYGTLVLGLIVVGFGVGLFYSSVTTAAVSVLPEAQSSLAGAIVYMCLARSVGAGSRIGDLPVRVPRLSRHPLRPALGAALVAGADDGHSGHPHAPKIACAQLG